MDGPSPAQILRERSQADPWDVPEEFCDRRWIDDWRCRSAFPHLLIAWGHSESSRICKFKLCKTSPSQVGHDVFLWIDMDGYIHRVSCVQQIPRRSCGAHSSDWLVGLLGFHIVFTGRARQNGWRRPNTPNISQHVKMKPLKSSFQIPGCTQPGAPLFPSLFAGRSASLEQASYNYAALRFAQLAGPFGQIVYSLEESYLKAHLYTSISKFCLSVPRDTFLKRNLGLKHFYRGYNNRNYKLQNDYLDNQSNVILHLPNQESMAVPNPASNFQTRARVQIILRE